MKNSEWKFSIWLSFVRHHLAYHCWHSSSVDISQIQMENRANAREESMRSRDNTEMAVAGRFDPSKPGGYMATPSMVVMDLLLDA